MFHIYYDGGTEFFDRKVMIELEPFLQSIGLDYTRLTEEEIRSLTRCKRSKQVKGSEPIDIRPETNERIPRPYQSVII
jgi:hypothetical protein